MPQCDLCKNEYDKAFRVILGGNEYVFDSFECAVHLLAPRCQHCGCTVLGHGMEANGVIFCCAHCAREMGESKVSDRADSAA